MFKRYIQEIFYSVFDLLLPARCLICGNERDSILCKACLPTVVQWHSRCHICFIPLANIEEKLCNFCQVTPLPFKIRYIFSYQDLKFRLLLKTAKYQGNQKALSVLIEHILKQDKIISLLQKISSDFVLPVPANITSLDKRGFDQSLYISKIIINKVFGRRLSLQEKNSIIIAKEKTSQARLTYHHQRRNNTSNVFQINSTVGEYIKGKNCLIVDDVITTGTTVTFLANSILRFNPKEVFILALAGVDQQLKSSRNFMFNFLQK